MSEVKRWDTGVYGIQYMQQDPNGAFVEYEDYQTLLAENERLRAEVAESRESWRVQVIERGNEIRLRERAEARAERLAEALRLIASPQRPDGTWNRDREACRQIARAALDQEGGNE